MKKVISINGMSCGHCQAKAETALNAVNGVSAKVNLKKKEAVVTVGEGVSDADLTKAITDAGYEVVSIQEKKGLFS